MSLDTCVPYDFGQVTSLFPFPASFSVKRRDEAEWIFKVSEHSWTSESLEAHGTVLGASLAGKGPFVGGSPQNAGSRGGWLIPGHLPHFGRIPYRARGGASWHWLHSVSPRTWWHPQLLRRLPASGSLSALPVSWFGESSRWGNGPCSLQGASSGALWGRQKRRDGQMGQNSCLGILLVTRPSVDSALYGLDTAFQYPASLNLSDRAKKGRGHHLRAANGWSSDRSSDSARPGIEREPLRAAVVYTWLGLFPLFSANNTQDFSVGKRPLSSVHQTWVGLVSIPGSKREEHMAWLWPTRALHSLGHSDWFGGWPHDLICPNNEFWEFFQNYWKIKVLSVC